MRCSLCAASRLDYTSELRNKQAAIDEFWNGLGTGIRCSPLVPSPSGRHYRTVSKRKAFIAGKKFSLGLIGVDEETSRSFPLDVGECVIEPASHGRIYETIQRSLQRKEQSTLVKEFNYVIVKGDDREAVVIFNMNHFSSANRREVNALSKQLTSAVPAVSGVFVFMDEERSRYYLSGTPRKGAQSNPRPLTKIFGNDSLFHQTSGKKFLYSPLSFSQTNHSILNEFTTTAASLLNVSSNDVLFDLYCGYGLFSVTMASSVHSVIGIELSRSSINDAIGNGTRNKATNVRFYAADISTETLPRFFPERRTSGDRPLKFLLDPPRNGTADGVIDFLAAQRPAAVLHIFCNADVIGKELRRWKNGGYLPVKAVPFDMFPGTGEIEMMVLLERK